MIDSCELIGEVEYEIGWNVPLQKEAKTNFSCMIGSASTKTSNPDSVR
jgi:hypothetical protein